MDCIVSAHEPMKQIQNLLYYTSPICNLGSILGFSEMGLHKTSWLVLLCWVFVGLWMRVHCDISEVSVKFLKTPSPLSNLNSATFTFLVFLGDNGDACSNCTANCTLDHSILSNCETREVSYMGLQDGKHTFEVCASVIQGIGCANYNWTVDTIPPTAYVTAATSFTSTLNVPVNISFSEPCTGGGGGFGCSFTNTCNLLVYGAGQVVPTTFKVIEPNLKFSLVVSLSSRVQYGRVILVMDKNFCTDNAGNKFTRTENSSSLVHFDRRSDFVNLRTHVPERLLQLNGETRTVQATNNHESLKVYLYFSEPVLNSSAEILNSLHTSQGVIVPTTGNSLRNRRFGFMVEEIPSMCIVTVRFNSSLIISRQGTTVSPVAPVTFLYDSQRPEVSLRTKSGTRMRENNILVLIRFVKPVFSFNSSHISISGGHLQSFREVSWSIYVVEAQADSHVISISIPENVTQDVAGNKNTASNVLKVTHYSVPVISFVLSTFATSSLAVTALIAGLLTLSTASLQSVGAFSRPSSSMTPNPARNLFRSACHIQVFALSGWLAVSMPVEFFEFTRGLQWSIPYIRLPWETGHTQPGIFGSSFTNPHLYNSQILESETLKNVQSQEWNSYVDASAYGLPLTPMEYRSFFESQNIKPEAEYILHPHNSNGWRDFSRSMFWLAVIGGSLILLHGFLLFILKLRKKNSEKQNIGGLIFPRFEIFLLILALPSICKSSGALIKGGSSSGVIVGILILGITSFLLVALFFFISIGITYGKVIEYKEIHQEGQKFHWHQNIVQATRGPGKRGQWIWKNQPDSDRLTMLGPLFEDLRGPPKYMLSQISGVNYPHKQGNKIIASHNETEDDEATCIQKVFGILRIYYTLLESANRFCLGIIAGAYSENRSSEAPIITLLCITSFQLFFLVLERPFIKKKVQLVEIISVSSEAGIFATSFLLSMKEFSTRAETEIGIFMLLLFFVAFSAQMINEWCALYRQTKQLDPAEDSFLLGLKTASIGILLLFVPPGLIKNLECWLFLSQHLDGEPGDNTISGDRWRSSGAAEKPWLKQLREMAKASFSKDGNGAPTDPSTSSSKSSGFWRRNKSESPHLQLHGQVAREILEV